MKIPNRVWVIGILCFATGIIVLGMLLENEFGDNHLSRSGSVVVFFAILIEIIALKNFSNFIMAGFASLIRKTESIEANSGVLWKTMQATVKREDKSIPDILELMEKRDKQDTDAIEYRWQSIENLNRFSSISITSIVVALVGTIVWGYGDLINIFPLKLPN